MLIRLSELVTDHNGLAHKIAREIYVQTESIDMLHEYKSEWTIENCVGMEAFFELLSAGRVRDGSYPTKIIFTSGRTVVVAESVGYIVNKCKMNLC